MKKYFLAAAGALLFASPAMAHKIHRPHSHIKMPSHTHYHCHAKKGYCHFHRHIHGGVEYGHHGRRYMHFGFFPSSHSLETDKKHRIIFKYHTH